MATPAEKFKGAGTKPGVQVWRVEKFDVMEQPPQSHGSFFTGDSYLVLHTYKEPGSDALKHNLHFWLGAESTQDETGSAAMFSAMLDNDVLGGQPTQFREVQGKESPEFLKLFPVVRYLLGGVESGFKHVTEEKGPARLYHICSKARTHLEVVEVSASVSSLTSSDTFVLEDPASSAITTWVGATASMREKMAAMEVVNKLRVNTCYKAYVVDDGDTSSEDAKRFFAALGVEDPSTVQISS